MVEDEYGRRLRWTDFEHSSDRAWAAPGEEVDRAEDANLVCSDTGNGTFHRPVVDLDIPCRLVPSSTSGHFHLYVDVDVSREKYFALLDALVEAGLVSTGYVLAARERGYTAVRPPHVKKEAPPEEPAARGSLYPAPYLGGTA